MSDNAPDVPTPAGAELIALAAATRPDWDDRDIRAAIAAALTAGLTWPQALVAFARLMADPKARPRELVPDTRDPLARRPVPSPESVARGVAAARAALHQGDQND